MHNVYNVQLYFLQLLGHFSVTWNYQIIYQAPTHFILWKVGPAKIIGGAPLSLQTTLLEDTAKVRPNFYLINMILHIFYRAGLNAGRF